MKRFSYIAPHDLATAIELLDANQKNSKLLAGGTDLIPLMKEHKICPEKVIDLKGIKELYGVTEKDDGVVIGALTPLDQIANSPILQKQFPYFITAILSLGSYQIRCRGTVGGNICNASPAADCAPILLALGASLKTQSVEGVRSIPIEGFFIGPAKTSLKQNEVLTHIHLPLQGRNTFGIFLKHTKRRAMDLAIVSIGVILRGLEGKWCKEARIAFGAVAPTPFRSLNVEEIFREKDITAELILRARKVSAHIISPISDLRASKEYRKEMVEAFLHRALQTLLEENKEKGKNA